ncbi:uncharacterized protein TNCV_4625271 [Trichonephila clavipes]|nr:uncharacterized protein TNCV_4625271 [Trichonephila clavipes]
MNRQNGESSELRKKTKWLQCSKLQPILIKNCLFLGQAIAQEGKRDDTHVENVVRQAVADEFSSEILTNRTRAYLSCASGEMVIKLNFSEPFRGVTYTDYDRSSPCKFYGDGSKYYELRIPLKGCGTKQFGLVIHPNDHQARRRFVEWAQNEIAVVPDFHKRILFSDEAHFWLNGYVNKQNCRIWSEANPQVYVETPLHPEKLTVWCALWAVGILLQKQ